MIGWLVLASVYRVIVGEGSPLGEGALLKPGIQIMSVNYKKHLFMLLKVPISCFKRLIYPSARLTSLSWISEPFTPFTIKELIFSCTAQVSLIIANAWFELRGIHLPSLRQYSGTHG